MKKTSVTFYFSNGLTDRLLGNPQCHVCMQAALHASGPGRLGVRSGDVLRCAAAGFSYSCQTTWRRTGVSPLYLPKRDRRLLFWWSSCRQVAFYCLYCGSLSVKCYQELITEVARDSRVYLRQSWSKLGRDRSWPHSFCTQYRNCNLIFLSNFIGAIVIKNHHCCLNI